jgi:hypothetical protein
MTAAAFVLRRSFFVLRALSVERSFQREPATDIVPVDDGCSEPGAAPGPYRQRLEVPSGKTLGVFGSLHVGSEAPA